MRPPNPQNFIAQRISELAANDSARIAFQDNANQLIRYGHLQSLITKLKNLWGRQRSPVVVYLPHDCHKAVCLTALLCAEVPSLALSVKMPPSEVRELLRSHSFGGLLTSADLGARVFADGTANGRTSAQDLPIDYFPLASADRTATILASDVAWLLMTSGSTGEAKLVALSWENLKARCAGEIDLFNIPARCRLLNGLSFAHDLGFNQLLTSLVSGSTLTITEFILPGDLFNSLRAQEFSGVTSTPLLWTQLLQLVGRTPMQQEFSGYLTVSGGSLSEQHLLKLRNLFPRARIIKTYGQTETFRTLAETRQENICINSCGRPVADVTPLLFNSDCEPCRKGQVGQLAHFGAGTMSGYFADPSLTALKMIELNGAHGILTGDYFCELSNGDFKFMGRKDDMSKHRGQRIYLSEIRNLLCRHQAVADAFVQNFADGPDSDRLIAWLVIDPESGITDQDIAKYCHSSMAPHKIPGQFRIVDQLPVTFSGKVDARKLHEDLGTQA